MKEIRSVFTSMVRGLIIQTRGRFDFSCGNCEAEFSVWLIKPRVLLTGRCPACGEVCQRER